MARQQRKRHRKFIKKLKNAVKNPLTYLYLFLAMYLVVATAVVCKTEPYHPEGEIGGWFDAVWHTIVAVVAAYYDFYMKTTPGRLASLGLLLFGMAVWSIITGKITTLIMNAKMKNDKGLKKLRRMKGHFLLCGWRPGFDKILNTVMESNPDISSDQIVLVNNAPSEQIEALRDDIRFKDVNYVSGDFSDASTLKRAFIETAGRVLVISDRTGTQSDMEIDSRTVLAVLTIKNLKSDVYVAAELLDEKFQEHLNLVHCDEIILTQDYEHSLLATASSGLGYSNVIKALISDDADSGIIVDEIPSSFIGKKYKDLLDYFDTKNDVLVGLLLNTGNFHQRKKDALREAQINPNIGDVVGNLKKVKTLQCNEPLLTPDDDYEIPKNSKAILIRSR